MDIDRSIQRYAALSCQSLGCLLVLVDLSDLFSTDTSELIHLLFGGTRGVTTGTVFATENGGRNLPTAVSFPFHDNITTSAFVSHLKQSQSLTCM